MAKKVVKLSLVRNKRIKASVKFVKDELSASVKKSIEAVGDDLAGFALVVWSKIDGEPYVSYNADTGPIGPGMLVPFVSDALARRVTVEFLAQDDDDEGTGDT